MNINSFTDFCLFIGVEPDKINTYAMMVSILAVWLLIEVVVSIGEWLNELSKGYKLSPLDYLVEHVTFFFWLIFFAFIGLPSAILFLYHCIV